MEISAHCKIIRREMSERIICNFCQKLNQVVFNFQVCLIQKGSQAQLCIFSIRAGRGGGTHITPVNVFFGNYCQCGALKCCHLFRLCLNCCAII